MPSKKSAKIVPRRTTHARPSPIQSQETVLLAVTGTSPAVLTETIWALAHRENPIIPSQVIALTTTTGENAICNQLLVPDEAGKTVWEALSEALHADGVLMKSDDLRLDIRTFKRHEKSGRVAPLADLRSEQDHLLVGDSILSALWEFVGRPDTHLIASIAGGFKTMSALMLSCVTLLGRQTDEINHVIVNPPYDNAALVPRFYFPAQAQQALRAPDGTRWRAAAAEICLASVPFVALRTLFDRDFVRKPRSYSELVARCRISLAQRSPGAPNIIVHRSKTLINVDSTGVRLTNRAHLVLLFLAQRKIDGGRDFASYSGVGEEDVLAAINEYRVAVAPSGDLKNPVGVEMTVEDVNKACSEARSHLRKCGSEAAALIPFLPQRGRFSLDLPAANIRIVN